MGDVINLHRARKQRDRTAAEAKADLNRRRFGRTIAEKQADSRESTRRERTLDGAYLEGDGPD